MKRVRGSFIASFVIALALVAAACARQAALAPVAVTPPPSMAKLETAYGRLPLHFEENRGQMDASVRYVGRARGGTVYLTDNDIILAASNRTVRLEWLGAQKPRATPEEMLAGTVNYLVGADPARWRTDIPTFARVRFEGMYPGVNAVFYGNERRLEYDLVVEPGADPTRIALQVHGTDRIDLNGNGDLVMRVGGQAFVQHAPVVYQEGPRGREAIDARYVVHGGGRVMFKIAKYDRDRPLVIDPVLSYATFLGGPSVASAGAIAVDTAGNAYVTGNTEDPFPTTNTISPNNNIFVTKLNATGSAIIYSTIIGGSNSFDEVTAIAVDSAGSAYITGRALSTDFPVVNAFQPNKAEPLGSYDGFVTKLNAAGNGLVYSSYIGGAANHGDQRGWAIAVDSAGHAYIGGTTASPNFPTTPGAFQTTKPPGSPIGGDDSGWVAKVHPTGTSLVYSTFLGGTGHTSLHALAIDSAGNVYVGGATGSNDFPTTAGAIKASPGGTEVQFDGFVAKLNPTGSALVYSTRLGGSGVDWVFGLAVNNGEAYVTGSTDSSDFPTVNAFQSALKGRQDAFVARLNPSGTGLIYSTYLGGSATDASNADAGAAIAVDSGDSAVVVGRTNSTDFPMVNPVDTGTNPSYTGFVTQFSPTGAVGAGQFSMRVGYMAQGVAIDSADAIYVTGTTTSNQFTATPGAAQPTSSASGAPFVVKLSPGSGGGGGGDTIKPMVAITKPSNGAWTGNSINIAATASDDTGLQDVKLWGNGKVLGTIPCSGTTCGGDVWWTTGALPAAAYEVNAVATDKAGNQTVSATVTIYKDAKSPVVPSGATTTGGGGGTTPPPLMASITSPANGTTVSGDVTVTFSSTNASGTPTYTLKVDNANVIFSGNSSAPNVSTPWSTTGYANGTHTLNLTVTDGAGRTATGAVTVTVSNSSPGGGGGDTTKPTVSITSPANGVWTGNSIGIAASASDNVKLKSIALWGNGAVFATIPCAAATCSGSVTWTTGPLPPAAYEVNAVATDTADNQTVSATVTIYKDAKTPVKPSGASATGGGGGTTPPPLTATITSPANNTTVSGDVTVGMAAGGASGTPVFALKVDNGNVLFSGSNGGASTASTSWSTTGYSNGTHTLNLTVTDGAGRTATAATTVTVSNPAPGGGGADTTPPSVAITSPSNGAWTGNSIRVAASASDNVLLSTLKFYGNGTQFGQLTCGTTSCSGEQWWTTGPLPSGKHTITVVATDSAGNQTTSAPVVINK